MFSLLDNNYFDIGRGGYDSRSRPNQDNSQGYPSRPGQYWRSNSTGGGGGNEQEGNDGGNDAWRGGEQKPWVQPQRKGPGAG